jgi:hypothetical protein
MDDFGDSVSEFFVCPHLPLQLLVHVHEHDFNGSPHEWSAASDGGRVYSEQCSEGRRLTTASDTEHQHFVYGKVKVASLHFQLIYLLGPVSSCMMAHV